MVPGRVQTLIADMPLPTDELMVRWTEFSAFTPYLQFAYFPWNYAPATNAVVRQLALVHGAVADYLMPHLPGRRLPVIRPLFYDHPDFAEYYTVSDEFFLGPDLLVVPVLSACQQARDVRLPPGSWVDAWTGQTHQGPCTLWLHPAPCPGIPLFVRSSNAALLVALRPLLAGMARGSIPSGVTTTTYQAGLNRDIALTG